MTPKVASPLARGLRLALAGWRRYAKTAAMAATGYVGDNPLFLLDYLLRLLRVMVLLALWRTIFAGRGNVSGMSMRSVLTYTLVAEVFAAQLAVRSGLDAALWDGTITNRFLRPVGIFRDLTAELCGRWSFGLVTFSLPLLLVAPLLGVDPRPAGAGAAVLFVGSLALATCVGLGLDSIYSTLMVALDLERWSLEYLRSAVTLLLTGALVPLALLPWGIGRALSWLPFASMASAPLRIYTGTGDPWRLLALQAGWSFALWPLARWLWSRNRERVVSYGG